MIRKLSGTAFSKILIAFISLAIIILNSNTLGAEGLGVIALIILAVQIAVMMSEVIGGSGLVYLTPRMAASSLLIPSYIFAIIAPVAAVSVLKHLHLFDTTFFFEVIALALFQSFSHVNYHFLLGKQRILFYNLISIGQVLGLYLGLLFTYLYLNHLSILGFIQTMLIVHGTICFISTILVLTTAQSEFKINVRRGVKQLLKYGGIIQFTNLIQLANYRLVYILIEKYVDKFGLGVFSVATQLSEALWIPGRSMGLVQYSHISNNQEKEKAIHLTLALVKISFVLTLIGVIFMLAVPPSLFSWIFGSDFIHVKDVLFYLFTGIIFFSISFSLSQFFAGFGLHKYNTIISALGLLVTLIGGFYFIPTYGVKGAAIIVSISYSVQAFTQLLLFSKMNKLSLNRFFIGKADLIAFQSILHLRL